MNTFFMNTCRTILVRGGVNLFILSVVAIGLFSLPQKSFAASPNRTNASTIANSFSVFCHFYYYDGQDTTPKQDTQTCQQGSKAFGRLLTRLAGRNANMWPAQLSLQSLAQKNFINVQNRTDFFNAITDSRLQALLDPNNDKDLLPTLWGYNSTDDHSSTNRVRSNSNSTNLRCQTMIISGLSSINACKVANNFCEVNDTNCPNSSDTTDCNNTSGNCTVYIVKPGLRNSGTNCSGTDWDVTNGSNNQNYRAQVTGSSSAACHQAFWFSPAQDGSTCQISMWIPDSADAQIHFTLHSTSTSGFTPTKTNVDESDSSIQNSWMTVSPDGGVVMNRGAWSDYVYLSDAIHDNSSIVVSVAKFVCTN